MPQVHSYYAGEHAYYGDIFIIQILMSVCWIMEDATRSVLTLMNHGHVNVNEDLNFRMMQ